MTFHYPVTDRDEDGFPDVEQFSECDQCQERVLLADLHLISTRQGIAGRTQALFLCGLCRSALDEPEPPCTCQQTDVDMFDPRGCEFHDDRSDWNVRRRAVTTGQRYALWKQIHEREMA